MRLPWRLSFSLAAVLALFSAVFPGPAIAQGMPSVLAVRIGEHPQKTRLVLDLSAPVESSYRLAAGGNSVTIDLPGVTWKAPPGAGERVGSLVSGYTFQAGEGGGRLTIQAAGPVDVVAMKSLTPSGGRGHRLFIDLGAAEGPPAVPARASTRRPQASLSSTAPPQAPPPIAPQAPPPIAPPATGARGPPSPGDGAQSPGAPPPTPPAPVAAPPPRRTAEEGDTQTAQDTPPRPGAAKPDGQPPAAAAPVVIGVEADDAPADERARVRFRLRSVRLDGAETLTANDLRGLWQARLGSEISLADVFALAEATTNRYRNAGYILAKAIVPPQRINEGDVRIQVIEGFVANVVIEGEVAGRDDLFKEWARKIKASRPLHNSVLERYTLLADDLPGATVKSVLRASEDTPGASDVVFVVSHKTVDASASFDNRAAKSTGPNQFSVGLVLNSLVDLYESTTLSYSAATSRNESESISFSQSHVLDSEGTTAFVSAAYSRFRPGDILKDLDIQSVTKSLGLGASHPVIRSRDLTLELSAAFTLSNVKSDALSSRLYDDRQRVAGLGASIEFTDPWGGSNEGAGAGYWLPGDAGADSASGWVSNDDVTRLIDRIPSKQVMLIADGNFSAPSSRSFGSASITVNDPTTRPAPRRSMVVMSSGSQHPVQGDGGDPHSVFAWNLGSHLLNMGRGETGRGVFQRLSSQAAGDAALNPGYRRVARAGEVRPVDFRFDPVR